MDKEPTPLGWIANVIEEATDGALKLVPVLQTNRIGSVLFMALLFTASASAAILIVAWKNPEPLNRLNHAEFRPSLQTTR